jgi:hypothetical protein
MCRRANQDFAEPAEPATHPGAMALLNYARQYYDGSETIFASKPGLTSVLYFLYFLTVESLLKAYLKAHGRERWGHEISELCDECSFSRNLGHARHTKIFVEPPLVPPRFIAGT